MADSGNIQSIPLATKFNYRRGSFYQDSYVLNGYLEKETEGAYVVKRPGMLVLADFVAQTGYTPAFWIGGPLTSYGFQGAVTLTQDQIGFVIGGRCFVTVGSVSAPMIISEMAVPAIPTTAVLRGLLDNQNKLLWQGANAIYTANPSTTIANPSAYLLVPSLCELDGTYYILDLNGVLWASAIGNSSSWPALNTVIVFPEGQPTVMVRHLQYLVAFSTQQMKVYYDAAISPGAPVAQETSIVSEIGVPWAGALTVQRLNNTMYWLGHSTADGYQVYQMAGLAVQQISTPEIARYIADNFVPFMVNEYGRPTPGTTLKGVRGTTIQAGGHSYYILSCPTTTYGGGKNGSSIVYDITTQTWYLWTQLTAGVQAELRLSVGLGEIVSGQNMSFDPTNGKVYCLDANTYQDVGQPITFEVQTALYNWGSSKTKLIAATYVSSDTLSSSYQLSWTDNDYQTYTAPLTISTTLSKKQLVRCGSTIERAWKITHTDNTPMRLFSVEAEVLLGAL